MISISHWGMFDLYPRMFVVPPGFRLTSRDLTEMLRLDGYIEIAPA